MSLVLKFKLETRTPIDLASVTPAGLRALTLREIEQLLIPFGNQSVPLGELFQVSGSLTDDQITFDGDLSHAEGIGHRLAEGTIRVQGHAGAGVGQEMSGGQIEVQGDVGEGAGVAMRGGQIVVRGSAGHRLGAAPHGAARGLTRGEIIVYGNAGNFVGRGMRRGLIAVGGAVGSGAGAAMLAGTLLVFGRCGDHPGVGMRRGTIGLLGEAPVVPLTFRRGCRYEPSFMRMLLRRVTESGLTAAAEATDAAYDLYHGDVLNLGRGEILIRA